MIHEKVSVLPQSLAFPTSQRRTCVLVLGMHRSGTSALARVLNLLGCDLPKTTMGPGQGNDAGHWESQAIADFNDRLLESAGSSWDDWMAINPGWLSSPKAVQLRDEASALLEQEFGSSHFFVLKDPRICRLAPFWLSVLSAGGISPRIVLPIRNPLETAQSLGEREGFEPGLGHLLWLRHVLEAEFATRERMRFFTSYDQLLESWGAVAVGAAEAFHLSWPRQSSRVDSEVGEFLDRKRRHHEVLAEETIANPHLSVWLRGAYRIFTEWTTSGESPQDFALLDRIRTEFDSASLAFVGLVTSGRNAIRSNSTLQSALNSANQQLPEKDARIARLAVAHEALVQTAEVSERAISEMREVLASTSAKGAQKADQLEQALAATHARLADRDATLARMAAERDEFGQSAHTAEQELAEVRATLESVERSASAKDLRMRELFDRNEVLTGRLAARDVVIDGLTAQLKELTKTLEVNGVAYATLQGRLCAAEALLIQREAQISEMDNTLSAMRSARDIVEESLRTLQVKSSGYKEKVADLEAEVERLARELLGRDGAVQELESRLAKSLGRLWELESNERDLVIRVAQAERHARESKVESEGQLAERFFEIATLTRMLGDRDAKISSALRQAAENDERLAQVLTAHEQATRATASLEGALASARTRLADAERSLTERFTEIARLTSRVLEADVQVRKVGDQAAWIRAVSLVLVPGSRSWRGKLSTWLPFAMRRSMQMDQLRREGLFDSATYLAAYPDVAKASVSPLRHYLKHGIEEGRRMGVGNK